MPRYDSVLLDADNTLFDFDAAEHTALRRALEERGYPFTPETEALYLDINRPLWAAFDRGEVTQDFLVVERFRLLVERLGGEVLLATGIIVTESFLSLGFEIKIFKFLSLPVREFSPAGSVSMEGTAGQNEYTRQAQQPYRSIFPHSYHYRLQRLLISHPYARTRRHRVQSRRATRPRPTRPGNTPSPPFDRCVRHPRW